MKNENDWLNLLKGEKVGKDKKYLSRENMKRYNFESNENENITDFDENLIKKHDYKESTDSAE
jgi:hypothetical protein